MITRICASLAMSLALAGKTNAFSPNTIKPLGLGSTTKLHSHAIQSEEEAMYMMMKADACAHSDSCSIDEAQNFLDEVMHIQSNCVSGTLASHQICDDVIFPSEVISSLRQKISDGSSAVQSSINLNPLFVSAGAVYLVAGAYTMLQHPGVEVFTPQEWWWAIRDGYAGEMMSQFVSHGGLPAVDPVTVVPFTPQEWFWSIRDGYFGDMVAESTRNGGFVAYADAPMDDIVATSFLPEEWGMAIKDGYVSDMISHYMKHGGL